MFFLSNELDAFEIRTGMKVVHLANVSKTKFSSKTYKGNNLQGTIKISVALAAAFKLPWGQHRTFLLDWKRYRLQKASRCFVCINRYVHAFIAF